MAFKHIDATDDVSAGIDSDYTSDSARGYLAYFDPRASAHFEQGW